MLDLAPGLPSQEDLIELQLGEDDQILRVHALQKSDHQTLHNTVMTHMEQMYKTYSSLGSERYLTDRGPDQATPAQDHIAEIKHPVTTIQDLLSGHKLPERAPAHLQTLMLGVIHRYAPF